MSRIIQCKLAKILLQAQRFFNSWSVGAKFWRVGGRTAGIIIGVVPYVFLSKYFTGKISDFGSCHNGMILWRFAAYFCLFFLIK